MAESFTWDLIAKEDFNLGHGTFTATLPDGTTATVNKIGIHTFLGDYYNVKSFGATGNGSTDDRASIQDAIDQVPSTGGTVYFPPGTYKITSSLSITKSDIVLLGAGGSQITNANTGSQAAISCVAPSGKIRRIQIVRLYITKSGAGTGNAIEFTDVTNSAITACRLDSNGGGGIKFISGSWSNWIGPHNSIQSNTGSGIELGAASNNVAIIQNRIQGNGGSGILTSGGASSSIAIYGNDIEGNTGRGLYTGTGLTINAISFCGNYLELDNPLGPQVTIDSDGSGFVFEGNHFEGASSNTIGIEVLNGTNGSIRGNRFSGHTVRPVDIGTSAGGMWEVIALKGTEPNETRSQAATTLVWKDDIRSFGIGMGTSGSQANIGGTASVQNGNVGTDADTNEKTLFSFSVPAASLDVNNKALRVRTWGDVAANGNTKTIRLKFGTGSVISNATTTAPNNLNWVVECVIVRKSATQFTFSGWMMIGAVLQTVTNELTDTATWANANNILLTGQNGTAAANDIRAFGFIVEYLN